MKLGTLLKLPSFIFAKGFRRLHIAAMRDCSIHKTSVVLPSCQLTSVKMDRFSYCGYDCYITNCDIGSFCSIANNVIIGGAHHPTEFVSMSPVFLKGKNVLKRNFQHFEYNKPEKVVIGSDVWIGFGATIKSGVKVGDGSVVGMGAVVTKDIPPYSVWVGNPAKQIKKRFDDAIIRDLLSIKWWDWPENKLINQTKQISNVNEFIIDNLDT